MLIHFAFGSKKDNPSEQVDLVINCILKQRKLKYSLACYEFLPHLHYPAPGSYRINIKKAKIVNDQLMLPLIKLPLSNLENKNILAPIDKKYVTYLPEIIPMICFINISFNKLKNSLHQLNYGKLGLAFNKGFIKKYQPKPVVYYKEKDLFSDSKVLRYNQLVKTVARTFEQEHELIHLRQEILLYRKPHKLWPSFSDSVIANISNNNPELKLHLKLWQYDRYPIDYDFSKEEEWRIAISTQHEQEYLNFDEEDIVAVIVPDIISKDKVVNFLSENYNYQPSVILFPS